MVAGVGGGGWLLFVTCARSDLAAEVEEADAPLEDAALAGGWEIDPESALAFAAQQPDKACVRACVIVVCCVFLRCGFYGVASAVLSCERASERASD